MVIFPVVAVAVGGMTSKLGASAAALETPSVMGVGGGTGGGGRGVL